MPASRRIPLPTDYRSKLTVAVKYATEADSEYIRLQQKHPDTFESWVDSGTGLPSRFAIVDSQIEFNRLAPSNITVKMLYRKKWDIASDSTNTLLSDHPDIYLYLSLAAAAPFMKNDARIQVWKSLALEAIADANAQAHETHSAAELDHEFAYRDGYDITSDSYR